jgi:plasmid stabilization system protein ParE
MTRPVLLRRLAQAEFDDAADWFEKRAAGDGVAFTVAVRRVLTDLAARPDTWPKVYGAVREAPVTGYRYAVYYRIDPHPVLSVFHTSRDPGVWQSRT